MWQDDWLMRQVHQLAIGLVEAMSGKAVDVEEVELDMEHLFGCSPDLLLGMSEGALLTLVKGPDGIDSGRAIALAVGLAKTASARPKALVILTTALNASPALATPELTALQEALTEEVPLH